MNTLRNAIISAVRAAILLMLVTAPSSCRSNLYDEDALKDATKKLMTVDQIDANHTWTLTSEHSVSVDARALRLGIKSVQVWTANPLSGEAASILAEQPLSDGQQKDVFFTAPLDQNQFYVALLDSAGTYTVEALDADSHAVDFTRLVGLQKPIETHLLNYQVYTYCYEDYSEFMALDPDYDYNDLVLRVSHQIPTEGQLRLNVTLAAVGTLNQVAAAIRLIGLSYDDIDNVAIVDGESFDEGLKKTSDALISGKTLMLRGRNNEAVVNLFEDAHYAMDVTSKSDLGVTERVYCNVSKNSSADYAHAAPRTVTYLVTVKDPSKLNSFTASMIDPFGLVADYSGYYELHPSGDDRHVQVLRPYAVSDAIVSLPWALAIPGSSFRYPLQGINLGFYKKGALFGAYMTKGHSFGEWAANHDDANDWYHYPTGNQVY